MFCILALYLNKESDILAHCPTLLSAYSSEVMQLRNNKWLIINEASIQMQCSFLNTTTKQFRIEAKPGTILDIPAGCTANGPEFSIARLGP